MCEMRSKGASVVCLTHCTARRKSSGAGEDRGGSSDKDRRRLLNAAAMPRSGCRHSDGRAAFPLPLEVAGSSSASP